MPRVIDKAKVRHVERCLGDGMSDPEAVKSTADTFKISIPTAYRYLKLAYQALAAANASDSAIWAERIDLQIQAQLKRALEYKRAIITEEGKKKVVFVEPNLEEAGRCIDRRIRVRLGVDKHSVEVTGVGASVLDKILGMTPADRAAREKELLDAISVSDKKK